MQDAAKFIRKLYKNNSSIDSLCAAHPDLPKGYVESLRQMTWYGYAPAWHQVSAKPF